MKLIKPSIEFLNMTPAPLSTIERAGRTCYKSEDNINAGSAERFVRMLMKNGHLAMIEHASASYRVVCDRGVTHEIVRHRLFSYAQESTRYCNYKGGVTFIIPPWLELDEDEYSPSNIADVLRTCEHVVGGWAYHLLTCENEYLRLLQNGQTPQQARSVLPNALKTEIVITGNLREWLHFFKLRCAPTAHPQMQEIANMILSDIRERCAVIFDNIYL